MGITQLDTPAAAGPRSEGQRRAACLGGLLVRAAGACSSRPRCSGVVERGAHLTKEDPLHAAAEGRKVTAPTQTGPAPPPTRLGRRGGGAWGCHAPRGAGALTSGRQTPEAGLARVVAGQRAGAGLGTPGIPAAPAGRGDEAAEATRRPRWVQARPDSRRYPARPESAPQEPYARPNRCPQRPPRIPPAPRRGNYPSPRPNSRGFLGTALPRAPQLSPTLPDWASETLVHGDRGRTPQIAHAARLC